MQSCHKMITIILGRRIQYKGQRHIEKRHVEKSRGAIGTSFDAKWKEPKNENQSKLKLCKDNPLQNEKKSAYSTREKFREVYGQAKDVNVVSSSGKLLKRVKTHNLSLVHMDRREIYGVEELKLWMVKIKVVEV